MSYPGKTAIMMPGETYSCSHCEVENYSLDQVQNNWLCPKCNTALLIQAKDRETGIRNYFYRKKASDLQANDLLKPGHMPINKTYLVLGVTKLKSDQLGVGLKEYGQLKLHPDEWVTIEL